MSASKGDVPLAHLLDGTATENEVRQILKDCRQSPEFAEELAALLKIERHLQAAEPTGNFDAEFVNEVMTRIDLEKSDHNHASPLSDIDSDAKKIKPFQVAAWAGLAAAISLIAPAFWILRDSSKETSIHPAIAILVSEEDAQWESFESEIAFRSGSEHHLLSGFAQLEYQHGTQVLIEGPSRFTIIGPMTLQMTSGRATAKVPLAGQGFTIQSPSAEIVDLGTEFGVEVGENGTTEVHVLDGLVEAKPIDAEVFTQLAESQAARLTANRLQLRSAEPASFLRNLPTRDSKSKIRSLSWSFDEGQGELAKGVDRGFGLDSPHAALISYQNQSEGPRWTEGVFNYCLQFDGQDDFLQTTFYGIEGNKPRTIAFWVNAPASKEPNGYSILGYGTWEPGQAWQISLNPIEADGPLGRIRVGAKEGMVIGQTDLRDGQWRHVAVVLYPGEEVNLSTNVLIYLDGKLERTARKSFLNVDTKANENSEPVKIGRAANSFDDPKDTFFFEGKIDEVHIFDQALSKDQIIALKNSNEIP